MQWRDEETWRALVTARDPERRGPLLEELAANLTVSDAPDLARLCRARDTQEAQAAIRLFHLLIDQLQPADEVLAFWSRTLQDVIAGQEVNSQVWALAHLSLEIHGIDYRPADLAARGLSREQYLTLSADQSRATQEAAVASMAIMPLEGALALLEEADPSLSTETLRDLALRWTASHDVGAIHALYQTCIDRVRSRPLPMPGVIGLLGRPTRAVGGCVWYDVTSNYCLYLEADRDGLLRGWKMGS